MTSFFLPQAQRYPVSVVNEPEHSAAVCPTPLSEASDRAGVGKKLGRPKLALFRFCPKCQIETDHYVGGNCKPCHRRLEDARRAANPGESSARNKAWRAANPGRAAASSAAYAAAFPEKVKAQKTAYKAANREEIRAADAAYRVANAEQISAKSAARYIANREKINARNAAYVAANKEKTAARVAAWRLKTIERRRATQSAWFAANIEKRRVYCQNRRARQRDGGRLSKDLASKLFKLQRGKCACCGKPLGKNYHLDHIMPIALGGQNIDSNMQLLRQRCNNQKHAKHPVDFMQSRGFLL